MSYYTMFRGYYVCTFDCRAKQRVMLATCVQRTTKHSLRRTLMSDNYTDPSNTS